MMILKDLFFYRRLVSDQVHSIDGLDHPIPSVGIVPYIYRCKIENIQGIILTHVHPDHIQAANENFSKMHSWLAMINRPM
jgi:beta-lactamase superfamily II metal-dependent hydrolase